MNSHFYVTLPSDSSAAYYPNNTVARFVTRLPERVRLDGDYEMGLVEIIYPHTWYNVDGNFWIVVESKKIELQSGYYENGSAIAAALNRDLHGLGVRFSFSETIGRFSLSVQSTNVTMSDDLQHYMGFDLSNVVIEPLSFGTMAARPFDANRGLNLMYVYCDVAAHTVVGDTKTPLLRVCNVTGKHGDFVRHTYVQPHYVPVGRREFDSIDIAINNELGRPMPFEYGKSVVTLHFRRRFQL